MGSAQWRAKGGILQHGTLPLQGDLTRILAFLALSDAERKAQKGSLRQRATSLADALGKPLPFGQVAEALAGGFAQALNLTFVQGDLTSLELATVSDLRHSRYAAPAWTARF